MIEILMSTYNGEEFLTEQLDSLLNQSYNDWHLSIRDDGSTDTTPEIITRYISQNPDRISLLTDNLGNVGVIGSFEQLLSNAPEADYYMFCDQDDVWMPDKVEITHHYMYETEQTYPETPLLAFTDLTATDRKLTPIDNFFHINRIKVGSCQKFNYICVSNPVAGCTIMINRLARTEVLPFPANIPMHDWWIAAKTTQVGRTILINKPTILYRQHGDNIYGAKRVGIRHYVNRFLHPCATFADFGKLRPMLDALQFGSTAKFYYYKLRYHIIRRL